MILKKVALSQTGDQADRREEKDRGSKKNTYLYDRLCPWPGKRSTLEGTKGGRGEDYSAPAAKEKRKRGGWTWEIWPCGKVSPRRENVQKRKIRLHEGGMKESAPVEGKRGDPKSPE